MKSHANPPALITHGVVLALALLGCSGQPLPDDKLDYAGNWEAEGFELMITKGGGVSYERVRDSGARTEINGPIKAWDGDDFSVGILMMTSTFEVSETPHEVDGVWKMTVDGVELTRTSP